ncbi:MAG TPA: hypothetical protein VNX22_06010, partial [Acidobacteriaceae bacterium]|nr:hypothetical protein [Acidobacteriaceae bacterium]
SSEPESFRHGIPIGFCALLLRQLLTLKQLLCRNCNLSGVYRLPRGKGEHTAAHELDRTRDKWEALMPVLLVILDLRFDFARRNHGANKERDPEREAESRRHVMVRVDPEHTSHQERNSRQHKKSPHLHASHFTKFRTLTKPSQNHTHAYPLPA